MIKNDVHSGHRRRIVERFLKCGHESFADYEILEMLLFATNRYGDTNPLSKAILKTFNGFSGLVFATKEELLRVKGVGEKTADLLLGLGSLCNIIKSDMELSQDGTDFDTHENGDTDNEVEFYDSHTVGNMLVNYFRGKDKSEVLALAIDNRKRISSYKTLFDTDFRSGTVRGDVIIQFARESKASGIILAHNHPFGVPYASDGDVATHKMVESALNSMGVLYLNHYIVSGENYYAMINNRYNTVLSFSLTEGRNLELSDLANKKMDYGIPSTLYSVYSKICAIDRDLFYSVYSECNGPENFFSMRPAALIKKLSLKPRDAVLIRIMTEICIRSITSRYKIGVQYSDSEICDFLRVSFYGSDAEYMSIVSFDEKHKYLGFDRSPRGAVNFVAIGPQLAFEWVAEKGAKEIYVAHNHPGGDVEPSYTDLKTVEKLEKFFSATGVRLSKAIIVSGKSCRLINLRDYDLSKLG